VRSVDKARITASFVVTDGRVLEVGAPRWCDLDERGVLAASEVVWLTGDLVCDNADPKMCSACRYLAGAAARRASHRILGRTP
jgi:hypothetical protein